MDVVNWRHTLVSWVNQTNFIEKPVEDLGYFDLNAFFGKFKEKLEDNVEIKGDVIDFIKEYYPQFEPHLDETGQISVPDYMYIYSLFLHFSCVRFADSFFQAKCIALKPKCQSSIQGFLEILAKSDNYDRQSLRTAIHQSTPATPRLSFLHLSFNTPSRTPKMFKNSPPTPTSLLLDEKGREIKLLRAQLESEKFERGYLEVQVKQYEERLSKLVKEQKQNQQEIFDLKNQVLSSETENFSPNRNIKEESVKKRLREIIAEKDEKIIQLKFDIGQVEDSYKTLSDKFAYTDKELRKHMLRVNELTGVVDDLEAEMQQKIEIIENLQMQVQDLETHISQTRANVPKEVLDSSGDLLDFSFNQKTPANCFEDETESENMGIVIDLKLKETEHENTQLRNELNRHNQVFTSLIKDMLLKQDPAHAISDAVTLEEHIQVIIAAHEELNTKRVELSSKVEEMQSVIDLKEQELTNVRNSFESEMKTVVADLKNSRNELFGKLNKLRERCDTLQTTVDDSEKRYKAMKDYHESLIKKIKASDELTTQLKTEVDEKAKEIDDLKKDVKEGLERESDLSKMHQVLEDDYKEMSNTCEKLKAKCAAYSKEGHKLSEKLKELEKRLKQSQEINKTLQNEIEGLKSENQAKEERITTLKNDLKTSQDKDIISNNVITQLKSDLTNVSTELDTCKKQADEASKVACQELTSKSKEIDDLTSEINALRTQGQELEQTIDRLKHKQSELESVMKEQQFSHVSLKESLDAQISQLSTELRDALDEKLSHESELERIQRELDKERTATINSQELLNKTIESLQSQIAAKVAEMDEIKLNSELAGDEMTQKINELQVATMRAVEEKRTLEEKGKKEFDSFKAVILKDKTRVMTLMTNRETHVTSLMSDFTARFEKLQAMIQQLTIVVERNRELSQTIVQLRQEHATQTQEMSESHTQRVKDLEKSFTEARESLSKLFEENKDLKCQNESLSNVATRYSQAIDTGNRTIEELSNDLSNRMQELEHANLDKTALEHEIHSHLAHISQLESELNAAETEIRQMNEKLQEKVSAVEKFQGMYETEACLTESLKQELDLSKAEKCALTDSVKQLEAECVATSDKCDEIKENLESQIATLNEEKTVLIQSLDKLSSEHQTVLEENDAINASNKKIIEKLELIALQKQQTTKNITALKESVQELKRENQKLKSEVQSRTEESVRHVQEKLQGLSVFEKFGTEFDTLKTVNEELLEKNKDLVSEVQSKLKEIEKLETQMTELEQKIVEIVQDKDRVLQKLEGVNEKLRETTQELTEKTDEVQSLVHKIDEIEAELMKKDGERNLFEIEVKKHEQEIKELRVKIDEQTKCIEQKNDDLEVFVEKLEKLTIKETSVSEEMAKLVETNQTLQSDYETLKNLFSTKESEVTHLSQQVTNLTQEKSLLERDLNRIEDDRQTTLADSSRVKQELQEHQSTLTTEITSLNLELTQMKEENHKLQQTVFETEQKLRESESSLENHRIKSQTEITELKTTFENLQFDHVKVKEQLEDIQNNINSVTQQNTELKLQNEKLRLDNETLIKSNEELHTKYNAVKEISSSKADIERLEKQFKESDVAKSKKDEKIIEMFELSERLQKEIGSLKSNEAKLLYDINILSAKLLKSRDQATKKEKEHTEEIAHLQEKLKNQEKAVVEVRSDLEGRLEKMKEKMTTIYKDEIYRIKNAHERELLDLRERISDDLKKHEKIAEAAESLKKQLHAKNVDNLELRKENEFMKNKLRFMENGDTGSVRSLNMKKPSNMPPPFGNLKMEDEQGEVFDNTYLSDLKTGRMPDDDFMSRNSLALSEIQRRNSQWQPHMRSAYPSLYTDAEAGEDEIRDGLPSANDSHLSLLSNGQKGKKIGGKTAYHRPGPPTPSKNAGRLSFGPENEGRVSGVMPKKVTSPKFKLFHSSKVKDESPENGFESEDLATIMRRPRETNPAPMPLNSIEDARFVTKRRQKDFNGNHPDFYELVNTDDYTRYHDNSTHYSGDTSDETDEPAETTSSPTSTQTTTADESFNYNELNKTESPGCCPLLVRRRSFDKKTNARLVRDHYKRRSQDKRIATFNTLRSKVTSQSATTSEEFPAKSKENCNNLNSSDNYSLDDVSCDFESLMHNKISEIEFNDNDDEHDVSTKDDEFNGFRNIPMNLRDTNNKKIDTTPFCMSRLPQLSRPSEMFVAPPLRQLPPKVKEQPTELSCFNILRLTITLTLIYFYNFIRNLM